MICRSSSILRSNGIRSMRTEVDLSIDVEFLVRRYPLGSLGDERTALCIADMFAGSSSGGEFCHLSSIDSGTSGTERRLFVKDDRLLRPEIGIGLVEETAIN